MSDPALNYYVGRGTTAERTAFVPDPATPAAGPALGYLWWDTDTASEWAYDFDAVDWVEIGTGGNVNTGSTLTADQVVIGAGSTDVDVLAAGTDGDVLTMVSGAPAWQAGGGGGGLTLLEQHTASGSASLDFTSCISSTYDDYLVEFINLIPATNSVTLKLRVSTNGGASYVSSSSYRWTGWRYNSGGSGANSSTSDTSIDLSFGDAIISNTTSSGGISGTFRITNPLSGTYNTAITAGAATLGNAAAGGIFAANYNATTAVNAFQMFFSSGNIASGTIRVYGLAK